MVLPDLFEREMDAQFKELQSRNNKLESLVKIYEDSQIRILESIKNIEQELVDLRKLWSCF